MMEQWNSGIIGSGVMQCWINGPATGGIDDKIKMAIILLKTNIPAFHHSIIPFSGQIQNPQNISIFSVGCRTSETLISGRNSHPANGQTADRPTKL
jgi:hypothetical protein